MRILVGPIEICGQINLFADGFRKLGHEVTTAVLDRNKNWWNATYDYDFSSRPNDIERSVDIGYLFGSHDVFLYQWARESFVPGLFDLAYLNSKGKKIISTFMGSDVRHYPSYAQWNAGLADYIKNLHTTVEDIACSLLPLRMAELFSTAIFSQPNQSVLGLRPYNHLFIPLDLGEISHHIPDNKVPRLLHIPSRNAVKGSRLFSEACDQLKQEGLVFELRMLENIPHKQVLEEMRNADIYLDELFFPLHGKTAAEAMAAGCCVVNSDDLQLEPYPAERPIWSVKPWNLKEKLREIIVNRDLRLKLANAGRPYVTQYHDHVNVCKGLLAAVSDNDQDHKKHFPSHYASGQFTIDQSLPAPLVKIADSLLKTYGTADNVDLKLAVELGRFSKDILSSNIPRWLSNRSARETSSPSPALIELSNFF